MKFLRCMKLVCVLTASVMLTMNFMSCSEQTANNNVTPHEITLKVLEKLGITPETFTLPPLEPDNAADENTLNIPEYYSGGDFDHSLDDFMMYAVFPQVGDRELTVDMFEEYSVIEYQPSLKFPFELVILKLPKTEGKVDPELLEEVKSMCGEKIESVKAHMRDYAPTYINYAEKAYVEAFDNFVFYCISENPNAVISFIIDILADF